MSQSQIVDQHGRPVPKAVIAAARARGRMAMSAHAFEAVARDHPALAGWLPRNWSGQSALAHGRDFAEARLHDLVRNDGWASAAVSRFVDETVGSGWRLNAQVNAVTLGVDQDAADEINDAIEAEWADYAGPFGFWCDAERQTSMAGLIGLGMRHRFVQGEAAAHVLMRDGGGDYETCVHVIDPGRISNPNGRMDDEFLRQGVVLDAFNAATGYHVRRSHPGDTYWRGRPYQWDLVPREIETAHGYLRPNFVHAFEKKRAGETRAVSDFMATLRKHRQVHDIDDTELQAIMLNSTLATFITSPFDLDELADAVGGGAVTEAVAGLTQAQKAYYDELAVELPRGAHLNFLKAGEKAEHLSPAHPNANFEVFERQALRNIASALGLTYEMLTMDWSQVNYSSARAAMLVVYRGLTARRDRFAEAFMMPIYQAWLEEAFDLGRIPCPAGAPGFYDRPAAWCRAEWIGPGRGWVDPEKEAKGAALRMGMGTTTLKSETAEQGGDWKENILQRGREQRFAEKHGVVLGDVRPIAPAAAASPTTDNEEPDDTADDTGSAPRARRPSGSVPLITRTAA